MPKPLLLLLWIASGLPFCSAALFAQEPNSLETIAQQITRLQYRFNIEDIDGIGELIEPLFAEVVGNAKSSLDLPQRHLIAVAMMKFKLASGNHSGAILPYLIALHLQSQLLEHPHHLLLVEPIDKSESFQTKYLPTLFFTVQDQSHFQKQFDKAVKNRTCSKTQLAEKYYNADKIERSPAQQSVLDAISSVTENPQPTLREIHKLMDYFFSERETNPTLARKSLESAVQGLVKQERDSEGGKLRLLLQPKLRDMRRMLK